VSSGVNWPDPPFRHLIRITDQIGLIEFTEGTVPSRQHGYCAEHAAYGLTVVCREPSPRDELVTLTRRYLYFLAQAQAPDGSFRNRLGYDRRWKDGPRTGDSWGRALQGLGTAVARAPLAAVQGESLARFGSAARLQSEWPHAMAFAALGAAEVLSVLPGHPASRGLLAAAVGIIPAAVRTNSRSFKCARNRRRALLTAGCESPIDSAARETLRCRLTASNTNNKLRSIGRLFMM